MRMKTPPKYMELIDQGYCEKYIDDNDPVLSEAYRQLKTDNPDGYTELMNHDYHAGRRDWVHEKRTIYNVGVGMVIDIDLEPIDHLFPNTIDGRQLVAIANMLIDGDSQSIIAQQLGLSTSTVSRLVDEIRYIFRPSVESNARSEIGDPK